MKNMIRKNIAEELKEKFAAWLFNNQNYSGRTANDGFYVQAYLNQIWQSMGLNRKQKNLIESAYREMIIDGYLDIESVNNSDYGLEDGSVSESRISLTDEGICHYIYAYE